MLLSTNPNPLLSDYCKPAQAIVRKYPFLGDSSDDGKEPHVSMKIRIRKSNKLFCVIFLLCEKYSIQQYNYMQIIMYIIILEYSLLSLYSILEQNLSVKDVLVSITILIVMFQSLNGKKLRQT